MVPSSFSPQVPDNARMLVNPCNSFLLVVPSNTTKEKKKKGKYKMPQHLQMKKISGCVQTNKKSTFYIYEITKVSSTMRC